MASVRFWDLGRCLAFIRAFFFKKILFFIYYAYSVLPACMPPGQKRAPDFIAGGCVPPCGCWELNPGPLEEQSVLLTSEPSLQPPTVIFPRRLI